MEQFFNNLVKLKYEKLDIGLAYVNIFYAAKLAPKPVFCFVDMDKEVSLDNVALSLLKERISSEIKGDKNIIMIISASDINNARKKTQGIDGFWLLNSETKRLIIYDNQPQELANMRYMLEYYLENGEMPDFAHDKMVRIKARSDVAFSRAKGLKDYLTMCNIIIIANVIVYIILSLGGDMESAIYIEKKGGLTVDGIENGEYYRMFTSLFLHYGVSHLFNNMLFIFAFGNTIEQYLGRLRISIVYFGGGIGGGIIAYLYNREHNMYAVTAGASGAAYALMGGLIALTIFNANARRFNNPAALIVIAVLFISEGFSPDSNVANSAHIGGIVVGFIITCIVIALGNVFDNMKKRRGQG